MFNVLGKVKTFLSIKDNLQDELLEAIKEQTENHLKALCGFNDIPTTLEFVVIEVMIIRFNRIGSEGMQSQRVDGLSQVFTDDDFKAYKGVIDNALGSKNATKGIKFI